MSSDEPNPTADIAEGVTKGVLDWSLDKIKELAKKFRNRELVFIKDVETINIAKEQRASSEWEIFKHYIDDRKFRILFQMGLTLRILERDKKNEKLDRLRKIIRDRYDTNGLHVAQTIQSGIFNKYIGIVLGTTTTPQKLKFEINNLFENIEKTVAFIQTTDDVDKKTKEIYIKINANSPKTFIISSFGTTMDACEKIKDGVIEEISGYECELYATKNRKVYFLTKIENEDSV
ncbi:MAG: hypothetical protein HYX24_04375 [Candidatus Aenigmarchaeota archaeon]|nr:hypothetical protein [Candidatus Aenigmarchaeota archaeon]